MDVDSFPCPTRSSMSVEPTKDHDTTWNARSCNPNCTGRGSGTSACRPICGSRRRAAAAGLRWPPTAAERQDPGADVEVLVKPRVCGVMIGYFATGPIVVSRHDVAIAPPVKADGHRRHTQSSSSGSIDVAAARRQCNENSPVVEL
jgi:hypothetical protein